MANFEAGVQGFTTRAFRGCGVVTSEPFEVSDEMEAVQMLQRFTQVGEFYVMSKPEGADKAGAADLIIYDEESDRHVKISYKDALIATGLVKADFAKKDGIANFPLEGGGDLDTWLKNAAAIAGGDMSGDDAPIVLARPFIEHAMLSAVLTVSGGDTGATIFGPSDMQISVRLNPNPAQDPCPASLVSVRLCLSAGQHLRQDD